jgi:hydroxypyruvate isomerase
MPKFAANLSFLFQEIDFLDRFEAAAKAGFKGVEYLFPYEHDPAVIEKALQRHGLEQVLFNAAPGDWGGGERGLGALPGREREFRDALKLALDYARALKCERVHAMAGLTPAGVPAVELESVFVANLHAAAKLFAAHDIALLIEPINTRDIPGYFLTSVEQATRIIGQAASPNLFLQFDIYHRQIMAGDLAEAIRASFPLTRHYQIAGVPGRHEPSVGEINYPYLFDLIDSLGYDGWIGCEYRPKAGTVEGLSWAKPYGPGAGGKA